MWCEMNLNEAVQVINNDMGQYIVYCNDDSRHQGLITNLI